MMISAMEKNKNNESYGESKDRLRGGAVTEELIGNLILEQSPKGSEETNMKRQMYRMRSSSTFTAQHKTGFFWLMFQTWIVGFQYVCFSIYILRSLRIVSIPSDALTHFSAFMVPGNILGTTILLLDG